MVLRIALIASLVTCLNAFAGFTPPTLPRDSRGVYSFEPVTPNGGYQTQTGGIFSLTIGFRRDALVKGARRHSNRDRAQELIDKFSRRLEKLKIADAHISVGKLYSTTRELIINVRVDDPDRTESVRAELTQFLSKTPGVSFVAQPGTMKVE